MKSFTSALGVRFLNVMAAIGRGAIGNLIGNPCKIGLLDGNCNAEPGRMVRKRPLPSRAFLTGTAEVMIAAFGTPRPLAPRSPNWHKSNPLKTMRASPELKGKILTHGS